MSERQLGAMLSQSSPPKPSTEETVPAETTPPAAPSIPAATPKEGEETPPADQETRNAERGAGNEPDPNAEATAQDNETPPSDETETTQTTEDTPAQSALPAELADAIEIAKGDGKQGLAKVLVRLHKLVDQRDTERNARLASDERIAALELQVKEAKETAAAPNAPSALNGDRHPAVQEVAAQLDNVDHWLNWCFDNPDGGEIPDGKGGKINLDAAGVRTAQRGLDRQRSELVARKVNVEASVKEAFTSAYTTQHAVAQKTYPELFVKDSPDAKIAAEFLRVMPQLKQFPDYEVVIGRYLRGMKLELAQTKAATNGGTKKPAPPREPTPVSTEAPGGTRSAERGASSGDKEVKEAEERYRKSGRTADLARLNAAKMRAQRTKTK